ncbi:MAG: hypothetical protein AAF657_33775 [Acidobacteriota bacterium]
MNLDPALSKGDRIGSVLGGIGLVIYASIGEFDQGWFRILLAGLGVAFAIGGFGGT